MQSCYKWGFFSSTRSFWLSIINNLRTIFPIYRPKNSLLATGNQSLISHMREVYFHLRTYHNPPLPFFTISPSFLFFSILDRSFNQLNLPKFLDFSTCVAVTPVIAITFFKLSILTYFLSKYELLMNMHVGRPHYHFKLDSLKNLKRCKRCPNTNRYKIHRRQ